MPERLVKVLTEFTRTIVNPFDRDELLAQLIGHTLAALDAEAAGLMLADSDGDLEFAAASGSRATQMEKVQEGSKAGVCYQAFTTNQVVIANDLEDLQRWPLYTKRAIQLGFGSAIGVPLNAQGQTIGVLNVYREQAGVWTERDVEVCEVLAAMGAAYILVASQLRAQHDLADSLQTALTSRVVIEQAKGILIATEGVDADTAFEAIRKTARDNNRKLRDVAQEIVERRPGGTVCRARSSTILVAMGESSRSPSGPSCCASLEAVGRRTAGDAQCPVRHREVRREPPSSRREAE